MADVYDHEIIGSLCTEAGITVDAVRETDNLQADAGADVQLMDAIEAAGARDYDRYDVLEIACDQTLAGNVQTTIALRRMFGLAPIV